MTTDVATEKYDEQQHDQNRMADTQTESRTSQSAKTALEEKTKGNIMAAVKVEGVVEAHLGTKGFRLLERILTSTGQTFNKPWTIWATQPAIGATVQATGDLKAEVAKHWETKEILLTTAGSPYVALSISDAQVTILADAVPAEAAQWEQPASEGPVPF